MKGEVRKLKAKPLTIDDTFTKDGLEAVSTLTGKEPYYVVGGMATQSYLPSLCRRPTSDIDLSIVRPLNYEAFKTLSGPVMEFLRDNGYSVETGRGSRAFNLGVDNPQGDKLLIEFSRRNEKSFNRSKKHLERELVHSKRKIIEGRNSTYSIATPEDIVVPKLVSSINSLARNPELKQYLPSSEVSLSDGHIKERLDFINDLRESSMDSPSDLEVFEELKLVSDIFDIRILSEIAGVNSRYFDEASCDWRALHDSSYERDLLFNFILPQLNNSLVECSN
jgi:hypothetical protein